MARFGSLRTEIIIIELPSLSIICLVVAPVAPDDDERAWQHACIYSRWFNRSMETPTGMNHDL